MKITSLCMLLIFATFSACGVPPQRSKLSAIIGKNNQTSLKTSEYANAVATFETPSGVCSAFVSGETELMTAAHCFTGESLADISVTNIDGHKIPLLEIKSTRRDIDVVTFTIDKRADHLQTASISASEQTTIIAYHPEKKEFYVDDSCSFIETPYVHTNNSTLNSGNTATVPNFAGIKQTIDPIQLLHTCDTVNGASGGILMQNGKVVAMHIGYLQDQKVNVAVPLAELANPQLAAALLAHKDKIKLESKLEMCGIGISVTGWTAYLCKAAIVSAVASCPTGVFGEPITGTTCGIMLLTGAGTCGVSVYGIIKLVNACID